MKKSNKTKKLRKEQKKSSNLSDTHKILEEKKKPRWQTIFSKFNSLTGWVASFLTIIAFYFTCLHDTRSQKEIFEDEKFDTGTLKFSPIKTDTQSPENKKRVFYTSAIIDSLQSKNIVPDKDTLKGILIKDFDKNNVLLSLGGHTELISPENFHTGFDAFYFFVKTTNCKNVNPLELILKDDRIYVSLEFKDLKNEETIGIINYNHWKLAKDNLFDYKDTDSSLVVWDKENNVVLSLRYYASPTTHILFIDGYFIGIPSVLVLNSEKVLQNCYLKTDKNWKQKVRTDIQGVTKKRPIF